MIGTATLFAVALTVMTGYAVKSAITVWPRRSFLQCTVLGLFCAK